LEGSGTRLNRAGQILPNRKKSANSVSLMILRTENLVLLVESRLKNQESMG
jgi:hypothetical protein